MPVARDELTGLAGCCNPEIDTVEAEGDRRG
jgi:hypothetical protein